MVSNAEGSLGSATRWAALEKPSVIVRMVVLSDHGGSPVTKSNATMVTWGWAVVEAGLQAGNLVPYSVHAQGRP